MKDTLNYILKETLHVLMVSAWLFGLLFIFRPVVHAQSMRSSIVQSLIAQAQTGLQTDLQIDSQTERPQIRVGLYDTGETKIVLSTNRKAKLKLADGMVLRTVKKGDQVSIRYKKKSGRYIVKGTDRDTGAWRENINQPVILKTNKPKGAVTIENYENRPDWNPELNDNQFWGAIELQYAPATDKVWVVNELGIEKYVEGVSEAGNENDMAYLKALYTAARSYVYYQYLHPTKHADEPYLVDATPNDQVYRGYGFTQRAPNIAAAVDATTGMIVHYKNEPVVTPYFSQTDGRTRAWSEVWAGEKAYLQSVPDPCCVGETLLGHGVGMSAAGARWFAKNEHWRWRKILNYYYTGIKLKKLW